MAIYRRGPKIIRETEQYYVIKDEDIIHYVDKHPQKGPGDIQLFRMGLFIGGVIGTGVSMVLLLIFQQ